MDQVTQYLSTGEEDETVEAPQMSTTYNIVMSSVVVTAFIVGIVGIIGNIIILHVYSKLGFGESINISYVSLAVSDLGVVLSTLLCAIFGLPEFESYMTRGMDEDVYIFLRDFTCWLHVTFTRSTALITAWISLERCLCVMSPMKVKSMITARLNTGVILAMFFISFVPLLIAYTSHYVEWQKQIQNNQSDFSIILEAVPPAIYAADLMIAAIYPAIYYTTVGICTTLLVVKLRQSSKWRARNSSVLNRARNMSGSTNRSRNTPASTRRRDTPGSTRRRDTSTSTRRRTWSVSTRESSLDVPNNEEKISPRQNRVIKTVVILATAFVVLSLPYIVNTLLSTFITEYHTLGSLHEAYLMVTGFAFMFEELNSSINIFVYAYLGTKFRESLKQVTLRICPKCIAMRNDQDLGIQESVTN